MTIENIETTPKRARRMAREYVAKFFGSWKSEARNKVAFAWERGYWACWNEVAERLEEIDEAASSADRDDLLAELLDDFLDDEQVAA